MAGLKVKIGADASQFERTMRGVRKDIRGVKSAILGVGGAVGAIWAVNKAFDGMRVAARGAFEFVKESSREAAGIESLTMQFNTLLGGASEAKDRIREITEFAATTPFEIKELAETSKLLQTLGGDMLATGDGLRLVGDAAAIAGQPIGEVGLHIGRLFNAITSGTSAGESVNRLQELGLIGGDVKREFEELAKAQRQGEVDSLSQADAMARLQSILVKTEGAMEKLAQTTQGKLSNLQDNVDQIQVAFGTGFNRGLKDALDAANKYLPQLKDKFTTAGNFFGTAISEAVKGDPQILIESGKLAGELISQGLAIGLRVAGEKAAETGVRMLKALPNVQLLDKISGGGIGGFLDTQADQIGRGSKRALDENIFSLTKNAKTGAAEIADLVRAANAGPSFFGQAQGMIRAGLTEAGAVPTGSPNPFNNDRAIALLGMIERHLGSKWGN